MCSFCLAARFAPTHRLLSSNAVQKSQIWGEITRLSSIFKIKHIYPLGRVFLSPCHDYICLMPNHHLFFFFFFFLQFCIDRIYQKVI